MTSTRHHVMVFFRRLRGFHDWFCTDFILSRITIEVSPKPVSRQGWGTVTVWTVKRGPSLLSLGVEQVRHKLQCWPTAKLFSRIWPC